MILVRKLCATDNCSKLARNQGRNRDGKVIYGKHCEYHHRHKTLGRLESMDNSRCEQCGWDKAPCDRHRKDPSLGYFKWNVQILCPNCHRLETMKTEPLPPLAEDSSDDAT